MLQFEPIKLSLIRKSVTSIVWLVIRILLKKTPTFKKGYGPLSFGIREELFFDGIHITPLLLIYMYLYILMKEIT